MSVIIGGKKYERVPGVRTVSWLDHGERDVPKMCSLTDLKKRNRQVRGIVAHTHEGVPGDLLEGLGPNTTLDERLALYQTQTDRYVSWDWTHDLNGDVTWQNDPEVFYTFQAGGVNPVTLGFEMIQQLRKNGKVVRGDLYRAQIAAVVRMIDFATAVLGIQRQIPWNKATNKPVQGVISRLQSGGDDFVGIYGHRNITTNRGPGDPGDALFYALRDAGYELYNLDTNEDTKTWVQRQQALGIEADGIPLKDTVAALKASGRKVGLWVPRPVDDELETIPFVAHL